MRAGYGRGYYGVGQLAQDAPPRRRSWFTWVAVLGAGAAVVWLMWPRKTTATAAGLTSHEFDASAVPPTSVPPPTAVAAPPAAALPAAAEPAAIPSTVPTEAVGAFRKQLEDDARARGFVTIRDYEDSVVATAKRLQSMGAQVVLAPHLQHLAPQLGT